MKPFMLVMHVGTKFKGIKTKTTFLFPIKEAFVSKFYHGKCKKTKIYFYFQALSGLDRTLSIWLGIKFRQYYGPIKDRNPNIFLICLAWHDPETQGVQELVLSFLKIHS